MMAGCYDLTLYCDAEYPQKVKVNPAEPLEVLQCPASYDSDGIAQTFAQAARGARKAGWTVNKGTGQSLCPACKKAGRKVAEPRTVWHR